MDESAKKFRPSAGPRIGDSTHPRIAFRLIFALVPPVIYLGCAAAVDAFPLGLRGLEHRVPSQALTTHSPNVYHCLFVASGLLVALTGLSAVCKGSGNLRPHHHGRRRRPARNGRAPPARGGASTLDLAQRNASARHSSATLLILDHDAPRCRAKPALSRHPARRFVSRTSSSAPGCARDARAASAAAPPRAPARPRLSHPPPPARTG